MTKSTTRKKARPKLVPISSSSGSGGGGGGKEDVDHFDNSFSRSFDDGGLGFGDILTVAAAATTPSSPAEPRVIADPAAAVDVGVEERLNNDIDTNIMCDSVGNDHVVDHENGVTGSASASAAGMEVTLQDDESSTVSDDNDDDDDDDDSMSSTEPESDPSDDNDVSNQQWQQQQQSNVKTSSGRERLQQQQLLSEIRSRQKLLAKILRGKEGTAYANMIQHQETLANSQLMDRLGMKGRLIPSVEVEVPTTTSSSDGTATTATTTTRTTRSAIVQSILMDEYYHTLPGIMSLIVHCALYITTYALIVKFMSLLCDILIIHFTGWDVKTNDFDCTLYEHAFYAIVLCLSLLASRITGVVYDWNDNKLYQKRIAFQVRNKWILKFWDANILNFFYSDSTRVKYDYENMLLPPRWEERCCDVDAASPGVGTTSTAIAAAAPSTSGQPRHRHHQRTKMFGWRIKYMIDLFSFFVCYRSVEYFLLYGCIIPLSEITDTVWANLPSRQQPNFHQPQQPSIHHRSPHGTTDHLDGIFGEHPGPQQQQRQRQQHIRLGGDTTAAGVSYACSHIRSALDNPYALDMLNWIASMETDSDEVMNWIANAKNCGWPGRVETGADDTTSRVDIECKEDMACSTNDQIIDDLLEEYQGPVDVVHSDAVEHHRTCTYEAIRDNESYYPERRRISAQDDDYLRNTVSHEAYYDFIRSPHPRFYDSVKEHGFWFVTTVICFGFLYIYDIPFLLI